MEGEVRFILWEEISLIVYNGSTDLSLEIIEFLCLNCVKLNRWYVIIVVGI